MQLILEVDDLLGLALKRDAEAAGQSAEQYLEALVRRDVQVGTKQTLSAEDKVQRVEAALERLRRSGATSGRDGRPWREYIHEGHRY